MKKFFVTGALAIVLSFSLFAYFKVNATTSGPNLGSTWTTDSSSGGTIDWTTPSNASTSNNKYATASSLADGDGTYYLVGTNFGFNIPTNATINGITVKVERNSSDNNAFDFTIDGLTKIVKGGVISGTNKQTATKWPLSDTDATYGSATDKWGLTWTPADINASNFGIAVSATFSWINNPPTASVDRISITVDYTAAAGGATVKRRQTVIISDE